MDGGVTWAEIDVGLGFGTLLNLRAVAAVSESIVWIVGEGGTYLRHTYLLTYLLTYLNSYFIIYRHTYLLSYLLLI
jgi:hypothetical protein